MHIFYLYHIKERSNKPNISWEKHGITKTIDYNIIINKLSKKDQYKKIPSDKTVSIEIWNIIKEVIQSETSQRVLYMISNSDEKTVSGITKAIKKLSKKYEKESTVYLAEDSFEVNFYELTYE